MWLRRVAHSAHMSVCNILSGRAYVQRSHICTPSVLIGNAFRLPPLLRGYQTADAVRACRLQVLDIARSESSASTSVRVQAGVRIT